MTISGTPSIERRKAKNCVAKWVKRLLRNRRVLLFALQAIFWVVKLAQAIKNLFGDP